MDKQMIEEMAKLVQGDMCGDVPCEECNYHGKMKILPRYCGVYLIAEILLSNADNAFQEGLNESRDLYKQEVKDEIRKETAEKFAEMAKNKAIRQQEFVGELAIGDIEYVKVKDIDEIAKQITDKGCKMGTKQEQRKIAFQTKWFDEIKAYSEYSGVPMVTLLTRLWQNSKERKV